MKTKIIFVNRILLGLIALIPIIFFQPFYLHFKAYMTGTIISNIVTQQWHLVLISIAVFGLFIIPLTYINRAKWIDYGLVGAFFVSLFIEMFGIPLTILFASKFLFTPGTTLPESIIRFNFLNVNLGMDHAMTYGLGLMLIGFALIIIGWRSLYRQVLLGDVLDFFNFLDPPLKEVRIYSGISAIGIHFCMISPFTPDGVKVKKIKDVP
jgi:hypothetical protein